VKNVNKDSKIIKFWS